MNPATDGVRAWQLTYLAWLARLGRGAIANHYFTRTLELPLAAWWCRPLAGRRLLDLGSGGGPFPSFLAALGARVVRLDLSAQELTAGAAWRPRGGRLPTTAAVVADARRLPFADERFDRVTALSSLEHVPDDGDVAAAREIGRVLRPGGRAIITVEGGAAFREVIAPHPDRELGHTYERAGAQLVRYYDPDAVSRRLLEPSGLRCRGLLWFGERGPRWRARHDELAYHRRRYWLAPLRALAAIRRLNGAELDRLESTAANRSNAIAILLLERPR